jgi:hypothetical protein
MRNAFAPDVRHCPVARPGLASVDLQAGLPGQIGT